MFFSKALMAYLRSVYLMSNKKIFNMQNIDVVKFSSSLGLVTAPRIRFLQKNQPAKSAATAKKGSEDDEGEEDKDEPLNFSDITGPSGRGNNDDGDDDNDLFKVKQVYKFKSNILSNDDQPEDQSGQETNMVNFRDFFLLVYSLEFEIDFIYVKGEAKRS
jgi:hypothetical protein